MEKSLRRRKRKNGYNNRVIPFIPEVIESEQEVFLSEKEDRFVEEFMTCYDWVKAADRCGVANPYSAGYDMYNRPHVQEAINQKRLKLKKELHIDQKRILNEYAKIAFLNPKDFLKDDGSFKNLKDLDDNVAAAISKIKRKNYFAGRGADSTPVEEYDYHFVDKKTSLDSLAKIFGMFQEDNKFSVELILGGLLKQLPSEAGQLLKEKLIQLIAAKKQS